jgi:hypothetical protein
MLRINPIRLIRKWQRGQTIYITRQWRPRGSWALVRALLAFNQDFGFESQGAHQEIKHLLRNLSARARPENTILCVRVRIVEHYNVHVVVTAWNQEVASHPHRSTRSRRRLSAGLLGLAAGPQLRGLPGGGPP